MIHLSIDKVIEVSIIILKINKNLQSKVVNKIGQAIRVRKRLTTIIKFNEFPSRRIEVESINKIQF